MFLEKVAVIGVATSVVVVLIGSLNLSAKSLPEKSRGESRRRSTWQRLPGLSRRQGACVFV